MKIDRLKLYEYIFEQHQTITAPQHFLRYVKVLLDKSDNDLNREHIHTRTWMAQTIQLNERTLGSYEQAWEALGWLEQKNPKSGNPATRKLGKRFDILRQCGKIER